MIPTHFIDQIKNPLKLNWLFLNAETRIVFTCGGVGNGKPSARSKVLTYAKKQFPDFVFFRAEDAFSQLTPRKDQDLLTLEIQLLEYADCVLIILESAGAIAELGAFSANDVVAKTILLVNDNKYEHEQSFLQLGPVAKIHSVSRFSPPIYTYFEKILHSAADIKERLDRIPRDRRKRIMYSSLTNIASLNPKIRLFVLLDIIAVFSPISREELQQIWKDIFGDMTKFAFDIAMLKALDFVSVESGFLLRRARKPSYFFSFFRTNFDSVRSRVLLHYFRKDHSRAALMEEIMMAQM